jgi:hypothetical protein
MEQHITPAVGFEPTDDEFESAHPLAENDHLGAGLFEQLGEQGRQLIGFDTVVGFMVEQIGAVARHAHVL